jgi:sulfate permease, SulP family
MGRIHNPLVLVCGGTAKGRLAAAPPAQADWLLCYTNQRKWSLHVQIQAGSGDSMTAQAPPPKTDLRQLFSTLTIGLVAGTVVLPLTISFGALIYSGDLAKFAPVGIGMMLFGALVMQLIVAWGSSIPGMVAGPQDSPAAVLALAAVAITHKMGAAPDSAKFMTVVAAVMVTSILSGILFIAIGGFKLSRFVRFIPYPVVGGFIAGTGLLIARGALGVMLGTSLNMATFVHVFDRDVLLLWLPGALFGVSLLIVSRRYQHYLITPLMLAGAVVIFYLVVWVSRLHVDQIRAMGLLLGPFPQGALWRPLDPRSFAQINWQVVASEASDIAAAALLSMVGLLLNNSALELVARRDADMNRELIAAGVGNVAGGLGGSSVGFHYLGVSALPFRAGAFSRLVGVAAGLLTALVLLFGASLLAYVPTPVVGGLLFYVGTSFLVEWLYDAWFRLPHIDYALVVIILAVVGAVGFLQGVAAGIAIAIILFVVNYSRVDVVKHTLSGTTYQSRLERPLEQRHLLNRFGECIYVLRLQGYLFFGTAQGLLARAHARMQDSQLLPLRFLLLDFQGVSALDSSAIFSFVRLMQFAEANHFQLVLTDVSEASRTKLARNAFREQSGLIRFFDSLDYGMEWCENEVLRTEASPTITRAASVAAQLRRVFATPEMIERFMTYLERQDIPQGHVLIRQGDEPDCLYLIDDGRVTAQLQVSDSKNIRLSSLGGGTMVGEAGMYVHQTRTATVVASQPSAVYRLSRESLDRMEAEEPILAAKLHEWVARVLSARVAENNRTLEALLE